MAISLGTGGLSITSDSTSKAPYGFEMTIKDTNPETTHYLACTTTTERDEWIDALSPPDLVGVPLPRPPQFSQLTLSFRILAVTVSRSKMAMTQTAVKKKTGAAIGYP